MDRDYFGGSVKFGGGHIFLVLLLFIEDLSTMGAAEGGIFWECRLPIV